MPKLLLPLVALLAIGGSAAGASVYLLTRDETVVEVLPSPVAEASPTADLTPAAAPSPTPTPGATEVAGKAPDGCLSTELAYVDPGARFAFCYLKDAELTTVDGLDDGVYLPAAHVFYPPRHNNIVTISFGIVIWPYEPCKIDSMDILKNERTEQISVDGQSVEACRKDRYAQKQPDKYVGTHVLFRLITDKGEPVLVEVSYIEPDPARAGMLIENRVVSRVLDSTVIY